MVGQGVALGGVVNANDAVVDSDGLSGEPGVLGRLADTLVEVS
jgi:hypothetical protein